MNRILLIPVIALALTWTSCVKEITLTPYQLPDLVEAFIRKVECFNEHDAALIASDEGVLLIYGEEQVVFNAKIYDELTALDWTEAEVLYSPVTEIFWIIDDTAYLQIGRNKYDVHYDETEFYAPTSAYFHHALSPEGVLYRVGYYKEFWDPNSGDFYSDYFMGIYKYNGVPNNTWIEYQTELAVKTQYLTSPVFLFAENGDLIINTNPSYRVSSFTGGEIVSESYEKEGDGFVFKTAFHPHLTSNGSILGLSANPSISIPVLSTLSGSLEGKTVVQKLIDDCNFPQEHQGAVKLIDWQGDEARLYIRHFTNNLSSNTDHLAYVLTFNPESGTCDSRTLFSNSELKYSESIQDIDVLGDIVYIGTRDGLLVYDLATDHIESYLLQLVANNNAE